MPDKTFFMGRWADDGSPVFYDPSDLTTHAVTIGMTGSGKTGLLIALLEETALQGIPAIIIDPKGDLTNLLLHFPEQRPKDFSPWIDPEQARRQGKTVEALAEQTGAAWREGLASWGLGQRELEQLRDRVDYAIYTPGSTAGLPVNLLSSFAAPPNWEHDRESLRERAASTVTALLGLVSVEDTDPLRSREHILLSNIFEANWSKGQSLDLAALIEQVQDPPFERLGAFPLERFFPQKDRFQLALRLNNFLAAPSFQTWLEGQSLDIAEMLRSPDDKPRFSIFYLAHLSETERMFFVTLLLAAVESWMRAQRGTSSLRAVLAFDEIVGYLPPVANPPSRQVLLRLLKQARAFGLGLALSTQNPTDLNYKALSNAGTWFIGRLQTERDKDRLLDGLQSLENGIDRSVIDRMIAGLGKRAFVLHNVHQPGPRVFHTRWALNYLAGPLMRAQLVDLRKAFIKEALPTQRAETVAEDKLPARSPLPPANETSIYEQAVAPQIKLEASQETESPAKIKPQFDEFTLPGVQNKPVLPGSIEEYFLPATLTVQRALATLGGALRGPLAPVGIIYRPALLAQAEIRYWSRRFGFDYARKIASLSPAHEAGRSDWSRGARPPIDGTQMPGKPQAMSLPLRYAGLPDVWSNTRALSSLRKNFLDWVYREANLQIRVNEGLNIFGHPEYSMALRANPGARNEGSSPV
jgi:hypothetical protein